MSGGTRINRRSFLKSAAGAGAGTALLQVIPASALGKNGRPAPSNRIVMGCIGMGGMGNADLDAFLGNADAQVVAVCDVDKNHLSAARTKIDQHYGNTGCAAYGDFRELLARDDLDAICLTTPDHWHAVPAIMALDAGMDVYGEKPISHCLMEGRAMANAQKRNGRVWQTGSWQRSQDHFRHACEIVRNGRLGKVVRIEVGLPTGFGIGPVKFIEPPPELDYDFWVGPSPWTPYSPEGTHGNWRWRFNYGGGQLMDWVGHHADIADWGMGWDNTGPEKIESKGAEYPANGIYETATVYHFVATYAGGVEMHVGNVGNNGIRSGTKWIGENGHWVWVDRDGLEANPTTLLGEPIGPNEIHLYRSPGHQREFLDSVKTRQPTLAPAETAHRSASIGHLGQIAMLLGRTLRWDPVTEQIQDDPGATSMLSTAMRAPWHV